MTTAYSIIKSAFRIAGILQKGESPDADEAADALEALNDIMESISNESLFVYANTLESFPLTSAVTYSIGVGGDFNTVRPTAISSAYVRIGDVDYNVSVISDEDYALIPIKSISGIAYFLNYRSTYPLGTINIYPASTGTLFLLTEKPLTTFTLYQNVSLPPGWNRYLKNQLAIDLCSEYGVEPPVAAVANAAESMGNLKRAAAKVKSMDVVYTPNVGNIYNGWWEG